MFKSNLEKFLRRFMTPHARNERTVKVVDLNLRTCCSKEGEDGNHRPEKLLDGELATEQATCLGL